MGQAPGARLPARHRQGQSRLPGPVECRGAAHRPYRRARLGVLRPPRRGRGVRPPGQEARARPGEAWLPDEGLFHAVFAHHGRPWALGPEGHQADIRDAAAQWRDGPGDPVAGLAPMQAAFDAWFGEALADARLLPAHPAFAHAFAGLLMLADWLGSNPAPDFFPFDDGAPADRMAFARARMAALLPATGIDARPAREAARQVGAGFAAAFAQAGRPPFAPRPIQAETARHPAPLLVLEAETGSGKTEAALWRFAELYRAGAVDGLYFALPTRVAATQIFERVKRFRDNVFPPQARPAVVLAVPGQMRVDEAEGARLPDFAVQWSDDGDRAARWAAEHPKRSLAAPIAVGTIDQALLGAVRVKHAHLRAASLLTKLLVIDEVHASDAYMERLLANLLRFHPGAGGHALLLSATLGAGARARLLGAATVPVREEAEAVPYPALSWCVDGIERRQPLGRAGDDKAVRMEARPILADPGAIAAAALAAARAGAKVLVVRNTVGQALRVQEALEAQATASDAALLFRVPHADGRGIATLHHSRFAEPDRRILDAGVEAAIGRERQEGGRVVIGTQTLEQSLDLDADLLVTDLCPVDVLLQRIGRLHRHAGRTRPAGVATPRAVVLVPEARELFRADLRAYGLGAGDKGGVYEDLRLLELTRRLVEAEPVWTIPAMNRRLVEAATHPEALAAVEAELSGADPAWRPHFDRLAGRYFADLGAAENALLRFDRPFPEFRVEPDEVIATRLGGADRHVDFRSEARPLPVGPFGRPVPSLKMPHHMAENILVDVQPEIVETLGDDDGFTFRLGPIVFTYDGFGLRRIE
ncbi:CRISPR-associated helicase Cas3' [Methylobacterium currus]|uniref:CRISPR-associated helicase Cas3' n=1 Tax=Methylobacterium currus TaxID=2051553 RepID=UPI0023EA6EAA|nr:CRISPR-associated helicase Cas3' [Methylobacterium currus]